MLKRDYILTMIEQFGYFLARIVFLKETQRYDTAQAEMNDFCGKLYGSGRDALLAMTDDELLELCADPDTREFVPDKAVALGALFKEFGDLERLQENTGPLPCACYARALFLLLEAYGDGTRALPLDAVDRLETAIQRSAGCSLPVNVRWKLMGFLEGSGFYADAEDLLYELIEDAAPNAVAEGVAFYTRLAEHDDADLIAGGLPRDEVLEGLGRLVGPTSL